MARGSNYWWAKGNAVTMLLLLLLLILACLLSALLGRWGLTIAFYLGAGVAWILHDRSYSSGSISAYTSAAGHVLMAVVWPIRVAAEVGDLRGFLGRQGRYTVYFHESRPFGLPDRITFKKRGEALVFAQGKAAALGVQLPIVDHVRKFLGLGHVTLVSAENGMTLEQSGERRDDLYQGSLLSKAFGLVSFLALLFAVFSGLGFRSTAALTGVAISILAAYLAYRVSGGRRNPALSKNPSATLEDDANLVVEANGEWATSIRALFDTTEALYGDNYSAMIERVAYNFGRGEIALIPVEIAEALAAAQGNPSRRTWERLREALIRNPWPHTD